MGLRTTSTAWVSSFPQSHFPGRVMNSSNYDYHRTDNGGSGYVQYNFHSLRRCPRPLSMVTADRHWLAADRHGRRR